MAITSGDILGGFGAAIRGTSQQYSQGIRQREQQMTQQKREELEARQIAMYQDAGSAYQLLLDGDLPGIVRLTEDRLQMLDTFPDADPSDTMRIRENAMSAISGDPNALRQLALELTGARSTGMALGILKPPEQERGVVVGDNLVGQNTGRVMYQSPTETPKEPGFEIVPVTEVSRISGLDPTKTYQRNIETGQISQIGGGGTTVNVGNATEGERKAGTLANRLDYAMAQINDVISLNPTAQMPGKVATVFDAMGMDYLATLSNDADRQIVDAAQLDMLDAALTLATGAAYTKEQLEGYKRSYFPQLGNPPEVIAAKKQRLQNTIEAAYAAAGRAAPENMFSSEIGANEPAIPAGVPAGSVFIGNAREDGKRVFRAPDGTNYKED